MNSDFVDFIKSSGAEFLGGVSVTFLFFFVQSRKDRKREARERLAVLIAIRNEKDRLLGFANALALQPSHVSVTADLGFLRFLITHTSLADSFSILGISISKLQGVVDRLNALILLHFAEQGGAARAVSGHNQRIADLHEEIKLAATGMQSELAAFDSSLRTVE